MPEVPKKITIDRRNHKVIVDGVEFPWCIAKEGPEVDDIANRDALPVVTIPIIAADVEVIPASDDDVSRPRGGDSEYRG